MNEGMEKLIDSYELRLAAVEEENKKLEEHQRKT